MRKVSIWFLVCSMLAVTALETHYLRSRNDLYSHRPATMLFVSALRGSQKKIILPDGSQVWLNAASTLSYPSNIATGDRTVELSGEAFFDVTANSKFPFKVRASELFIEVLGTRFNVRNYPDDARSGAIVARGAIRVQYHDHSSILRAGEAIEINPDEMDSETLQTKRQCDTVAATGWTKGVFTFKGSDLRTLLRELSRVYDTDIQLEGRASDHRFQGSLSLDEPLESVLQRLIVPYTDATIVRSSKQRLIVKVNR